MMVFSFILVVGLAAVISNSFGREIIADVSAPWRKYSLDFLVELSQYLSSVREDPTVKKTSDLSSAFWDFQQSLCQKNTSIDKAIVQSDFDAGTLREEITSLAKLHLPKNYQDLAELFLDLQNYVASVSFFNSLADVYSAPCGYGNAFIVSQNGQIECSLQSLNDLLTSDLSHHFEEWEHVYPSGLVSSSKHVTLYGIPGSNSLCNVLESAFSAVQDAKISSFSFRPALSLMNAEANKTVLQGYGVFLDIKNMEYKNVDDTTASAKQDDVESDIDAGFSSEEIAGVNFKKLFEYNQHSKKELRMLQDRLLQLELSASDNLKEEMKVWQMKDLGLQVVQTMNAIFAKGSIQDAVQHLTEVVHNFPRFASRISATKVTHQIQEDSEKYQMSGVANYMPPNALYINGLRIDLSEPSFNIFDVLQKVQAEVSRESQLSHFNLGRIYSRRVYEAAYTSLDPNLDSMEEEEDVGKDVIRVDVSKGGKFAVSFLNNLEKDDMYAQWPKTLKTLLYPSWSLHALSRNLYTVVIIADVLSAGGATLLQHARSMYMQQYPLRFGFVLDCDNASPLDSSMSAVESTTSDGSSSVRRSDICRVFASLKEKKGVQRAMNFIFSIADLVTESEAQGTPLSLTKQQLLQIAASDQGGNGLDSEMSLTALLSSFSRSASKSMISELDGVLKHPTKFMDFVSNSTAYVKARNLPKNSYSLNGIVVNEASLSSQTFMQILGREQYLLTNWVKARRLQDKTKNTLFTDIMTITKAYSRFHSLLDDKATAEYVDSLETSVLDVMKNALVITTQGIDDSQVAGDELLVVAQTTTTGIQSVIQSLKWLQNPSESMEEKDEAPTDSKRPINIRLAWRSDVSASSESTPAEVAVSATGEVLANSQNVRNSTFQRIHEVMPTSPCVGTCVGEFQEALESILQSLNSGEELKHDSSASNEAVALARNADQLVSKGFTKDLSKVEAVVAYNGRLLPTSYSETLQELAIDASDLQLLRTIEAKKISKLTRQLVADLDLAMEHSIVPKATYLRRSMLRFLLSAYKQVLDSMSRRFDVGSLLQRHLFARGLDIPSLLYTVTPPSAGSDDDEFLFSSHHDNLQLYVVVDPLSLAGQRAVTIIDLLTTRLRATVTLLLTPRTEINEFPLQNFYRFVLRNPSMAATDNEGAAAHQQQVHQVARFASLPRQHVLTVRMDTPEPWNVQATHAQQDPDNLRCTAQSCGDIHSAVTASNKELSVLGYTLKSLLVAGQCLQSTERDVSEGRYGLPPNGLQLILTTNDQAKEDSPAVLWDTLVMQNLGYFQLQAKTPGWYRVQLARGKASSLYRIHNQANAGLSLEQQEEKAVAGLSTPVLGFGDNTHRLTVVKRRGMESYSLLDAIDESPQKSGLWSTLSSGLFGSDSSRGNKKAVVATPAHEDDDKIHVFSLASGHMYERLLRIMMLSVSRQASRPVKFWLLENYLSPAFKDMAAVMSAKFGFEVAYVTYKWPHWLRHQTQQQRIIWGYKILFLDVLFPLHLKKVIYVDSDQVVRSDIAELWDMDLQGHAYGYTPFCTSRPETLGFQFWRQGYWKDHLQGRPYHISALYVVDLQRFRQQTVGDQLRAVYDQLSRDPNSLANLDQDLPNYAQHSVPIFSLPQEWLWCETWCSEDSKTKAKTIDLCNNPLHKEPKLDMARRVISGKLFNNSWIELDSEIRDLATSAGLLQE